MKFVLSLFFIFTLTVVEVGAVVHNSSNNTCVGILRERKIIDPALQTLITFKSFVSGSVRTYRVGYLDSSASRVFKTTDGELIIKAFSGAFEDTTYSEDQEVFSDYSLPFVETVRLRFLKESGFTVPEVKDYSPEIFDSETEDTAYLVKSFVEGRAAGDLIELLSVEYASGVGAVYRLAPKLGSGLVHGDIDQLNKKISELKSFIKANFLNWLKDKLEYASYYEYLLAQNRELYFDLFYENWLLTNEGEWVLIDP